MGGKSDEAKTIQTFQKSHHFTSHISEHGSEVQCSGQIPALLLSCVTLAKGPSWCTLDVLIGTRTAVPSSLSGGESSSVPGTQKELLIHVGYFYY